MRIPCFLLVLRPPERNENCSQEDASREYIPFVSQVPGGHPPGEMKNWFQEETSDLRRQLPRWLALSD